HGDVKFVQHRVWAERSRIVDLFRLGAIVYVCGDGRRMAPAVREALVAIYREAADADEPSAHAWGDAMEGEHGRASETVLRKKPGPTRWSASTAGTCRTCSRDSLNRDRMEQETDNQAVRQ